MHTIKHPNALNMAVKRNVHVVWIVGSILNSITIKKRMRRRQNLLLYSSPPLKPTRVNIQKTRFSALRQSAQTMSRWIHTTRASRHCSVLSGAKRLFVCVNIFRTKCEKYPDRQLRSITNICSSLFHSILLPLHLC